MSLSSALVIYAEPEGINFHVELPEPMLSSFFNMTFDQGRSRFSMYPNQISKNNSQAFPGPSSCLCVTACPSLELLVVDFTVTKVTDSI